MHVKCIYTEKEIQSKQLLTIGTIAALIEYAADASAAHSHRLLDMRPILSYSLTPVEENEVFRYIWPMGKMDLEFN